MHEQPTTKITVKNPTRSRKWGWGWTSAGVDTPGGWRLGEPAIEVTGTIDQILSAIAEDRDYQTLLSGNTLLNVGYFYDGQRLEWREWGRILREIQEDRSRNRGTKQVEFYVRA